MKAIPLPAGSALMSFLQASSPPAEAPIPITGKFAEELRGAETGRPALAVPAPLRPGPEGFLAYFAFRGLLSDTGIRPRYHTFSEWERARELRC